ncbi:hypothetical protein HZB00_00165 [Candidatus Woesearchaeota archaeon]|nr:hypothetical protein [Candidatus Woesearchaeota archaeon]
MLKEKAEIFYKKNYKIIMFIPVLFLLLSLGVVINHAVKTGDLFEKDVSLKGGISATVYTQKQVDEAQLKNAIHADATVRRLADVTTGKQIGFLIEESDIKADQLQAVVEQQLGEKLTQKNYSVEETEAKLGQAFYKQLMIAILLAFILMSLSVFVTFRTFIPSIAVIEAAFTDIIVPLAVLVFFHIKVSAAGIVAFLLVIGYSVDTDILLTTWALRKREHQLFDRMWHSMKTGLTMTTAAIVVMATGLIFSTSPVIKEMFFIILLSLCTDIFTTYLTNAGILSWYCEKKNIQ